MRPHAGHLKTGLEMCRVERMRPSNVVELVAKPQQGLHGQVVSPTQAQVLHHLREPDSMRVARGHGSSS